MPDQSTPNGQVIDLRDRAQELDALLRQHAPTVELWLVALAEFHRDRLWSVMGYQTWTAWAQERIGKSNKTVYRWLHKGYDLLPSPTATAATPSFNPSVKTPSPTLAPNPPRPGRPFGAKDKTPRYRAEPAPDPPRGPFIPPPKPLPPDNMVTCRHCGGTGLVPAPTKAAPALTLPYYCGTCGKDFRYSSPRCPQCRSLGTIKAR